MCCLLYFYKWRTLIFWLKEFNQPYLMLAEAENLFKSLEKLLWTSSSFLFFKSVLWELKRKKKKHWKQGERFNDNHQDSPEVIYQSYNGCTRSTRPLKHWRRSQVGRVPVCFSTVVWICVPAPFVKHRWVFTKTPHCLVARGKIEAVDRLTQLRSDKHSAHAPNPPAASV